MYGFQMYCRYILWVLTYWWWEGTSRSSGTWRKKKEKEKHDELIATGYNLILSFFSLSDSPESVLAGEQKGCFSLGAISLFCSSEKIPPYVAKLDTDSYLPVLWRVSLCRNFTGAGFRPLTGSRALKAALPWVCVCVGGLERIKKGSWVRTWGGESAGLTVKEPAEPGGLSGVSAPWMAGLSAGCQ